MQALRKETVTNFFLNVYSIGQFQGIIYTQLTIFGSQNSFGSQNNYPKVSYWFSRKV